jgi:ribA/ribD-fused uncharacterized protein
MADEYRRAGIEPSEDYKQGWQDGASEATELLTSAGEPDAVDDDHVCGVCEGTQRGTCGCTTPPPSLLREVAAIAYDTSKAAEDRIRDIQDLWEGATAPPSAGPLTLDTDSQVFFYEQDHYYLSNFSAFRLRWDGIDFDTSEHAYHWEKFKISGVDTSRVGRLIYGARSAHEAFKIAEALKGERRADWDSVKVDAMRRILREKARQHEYVRRKLLETGARQLIENSWRDDYWGWGEKRDGQNMLGKLWMEIRAELHGSSQTKSGDPK